VPHELHVPALTHTDEGPAGTLVVLDRIRRTRSRGPAPASPAIRVLVADGQALVRAGFRALLDVDGRTNVVAEATTGEEAVALARQIRPDVVLMDAMLPGLDCVEATRRVLVDPAVPVLLLTPSGDDDRGFAALRAGASGLLLKDTEPAELVHAVEVLAQGEALLSPSLTRRLITEFTSRPEPVRPNDELLDELTAREREVMALVAIGLSNGEIGEQLVISPATARTHVSRAMIKLHARDRAQLVVFAYEARLVLQPAGCA
jgi:DNA-binding NarL/FixJ family response regulator